MPKRNKLQLLLNIFRSTSEANEQLAEVPPRGWNSFDSFSWTVDENAYLQNAKILAEKLLPHGYQVRLLTYQNNGFCYTLTA
jgi:hypothetical protein